jgi:hypothetical protein
MVTGLEFFRKDVLTLLAVLATALPQIVMPAGVIQKIGLLTFAKTFNIPLK